MKLKIFLLLFSCFVSSGLFAQTPKEIETDLLKSFKQIDYWAVQKSDDTTGTIMDSLFSANEDFNSKLGDYAVKCPFTINLPFDSLINAGLTIVNSDDGKLRIYSWDANTGGDQHDISNIFQFKTSTGTDTLSNVPVDPYGTPADIDKIYQFEINGKTYYPIIYNMVVGIKFIYKGIMMFGIEKGKLNTDVRLIKTKSGLHNHLNCYIESSINDRSDAISEITFNPKTKTISLPLIDENDRATNKVITYKFTGQYFEKVKP